MNKEGFRPVEILCSRVNLGCINSIWRRIRTFLTRLFQTCPPTLTLTVFCISPAVTTMP